jgi:hypothetical protein
VQLTVGKNAEGEDNKAPVFLFKALRAHIAVIDNPVCDLVLPLSATATAKNRGRSRASITLPASPEHESLHHVTG